MFFDEELKPIIWFKIKNCLFFIIDYVTKFGNLKSFADVFLQDNEQRNKNKERSPGSDHSLNNNMKHKKLNYTLVISAPPSGLEPETP